MKEIRWHGRGGNGAFTAAKLLGLSASIYEGKSAQAFPSFGPERRGAPVLGFTRISDEVITDHSQVYECDCVVVLDETLCDVVDVTTGLKENAIILINSMKTAEEYENRADFKGVKNIKTIDATSIALELLGRPIVNTIMLGALIGATRIIAMESLEMAIDAMMSESLKEKNKHAARVAYEMIIGGK